MDKERYSKRQNDFDSSDDSISCRAAPNQTSLDCTHGKRTEKYGTTIDLSLRKRMKTIDDSLLEGMFRKFGEYIDMVCSLSNAKNNMRGEPLFTELQRQTQCVVPSAKDDSKDLCITGYRCGLCQETFMCGHQLLRHMIAECGRRGSDHDWLVNSGKLQLFFCSVCCTFLPTSGIDANYLEESFPLLILSHMKHHEISTLLSCKGFLVLDLLKQSHFILSVVKLYVSETSSLLNGLSLREGITTPKWNYLAGVNRLEARRKQLATEGYRMKGETDKILQLTSILRRMKITPKCSAMQSACGVAQLGKIVTFGVGCLICICTACGLVHELTKKDDFKMEKDPFLLAHYDSHSVAVRFTHPLVILESVRGGVSFLCMVLNCGKTFYSLANWGMHLVEHLSLPKMNCKIIRSKRKLANILFADKPVWDILNHVLFSEVQQSGVQYDANPCFLDCLFFAHTVIKAIFYSDPSCATAMGTVFISVPASSDFRECLETQITTDKLPGGSNNKNCKITDPEDSTTNSVSDKTLQGSSVKKQPQSDNSKRVTLSREKSEEFYGCASKQRGLKGDSSEPPLFQNYSAVTAGFYHELSNSMGSHDDKSVVGPEAPAQTGILRSMLTAKTTGSDSPLMTLRKFIGDSKHTASCSPFLKLNKCGDYIKPMMGSGPPLITSIQLDNNAHGVEVPNNVFVIGQLITRLRWTRRTVSGTHWFTCGVCSKKYISPVLLITHVWEQRIDHCPFWTRDTAQLFCCSKCDIYLPTVNMDGSPNAFPPTVITHLISHKFCSNIPEGFVYFNIATNADVRSLYRILEVSRTSQHLVIDRSMCIGNWPAFTYTLPNASIRKHIFYDIFSCKVCPMCRVFSDEHDKSILVKHRLTYAFACLKLSSMLNRPIAELVSSCMERAEKSIVISCDPADRFAFIDTCLTSSTMLPNTLGDVISDCHAFIPFELLTLPVFIVDCSSGAIRVFCVHCRKGFSSVSSWGLHFKIHIHLFPLALFTDYRIELLLESLEGSSEPIWKMVHKYFRCVDPSTGSSSDFVTPLISAHKLLNLLFAPGASRNVFKVNTSTDSSRVNTPARLFEGRKERLNTNEKSTPSLSGEAAGKLDFAVRATFRPAGDDAHLDGPMRSTTSENLHGKAFSVSNAEAPLSFLHKTTHTNSDTRYTDQAAVVTEYPYTSPIQNIQMREQTPSRDHALPRCRTPEKEVLGGRGLNRDQMGQATSIVQLVASTMPSFKDAEEQEQTRSVEKRDNIFADSCENGLTFNGNKTEQCCNKQVTDCPEKDLLDKCVSDWQQPDYSGSGDNDFSSNSIFPLEDVNPQPEKWVSTCTRSHAEMAVGRDNSRTSEAVCVELESSYKKELSRVKCELESASMGGFPCIQLEPEDIYIPADNPPLSAWDNALDWEIKTEPEGTPFTRGTPVPGDNSALIVWDNALKSEIKEDPGDTLTTRDLTIYEDHPSLIAWDNAIKSVIKEDPGDTLTTRDLTVYEDHPSLIVWDNAIKSEFKEEMDVTGLTRESY